MSVVIRGIKMPTNCNECPCQALDDEKWECYCYVDETILVDDATRPIRCPLIELPEHHGDLIDRKDVLDACEFIGERPTVDNPYSEKYACRSEIIENIPAVIEEE